MIKLSFAAAQLAGTPLARWDELCRARRLCLHGQRPLPGGARWGLRIQAGFNAWPQVACEADPMPLRALLVDDNQSFLTAASGLLEDEGITVVGLASNAADAHALAAQLAPDVILVDILLGDESGFDLARALAAEHDPGPAVILISTHAEADFADLVASSPALAFLPKSELSADPIRRILGAR